MKRFFSPLALVFAVFVFPAFVSAQTTNPTPAPYSEQALTRQLGGLLFGARQNPDLALTHDQAQKLLPLLQQWKSNPQLGDTEAQKIWNQAQTYLTSGQKNFKPSFGDRRGPPSQNHNLTPEERNARALDRLISRLQSL